MQLMRSVELPKRGHIFASEKWLIIYISYIKPETFFDWCSKTHTAIKKYKFGYDRFVFYSICEFPKGRA